MSEAFGRKDEVTYLGVCEEVVGWFLTEQLHRGKVTGGGVSRQLLQQSPPPPPSAAAAESIPGLFLFNQKAPLVRSSASSLSSETMICDSYLSTSPYHCLHRGVSVPVSFVALVILPLVFDS